MDSEFDDKFDVTAFEITTLEERSRDIPDNEELDVPVRDILNAVERAMDEEVDRLLGMSSNFEWQEGFETFKGVPEFFSGPSQAYG